MSLENMPRSLLLQPKQNLTEGPPLFERLNLLPLLENFLVSTHDSLGTAVQTDREAVSLVTKDLRETNRATQHGNFHAYLRY